MAVLRIGIATAQEDDMPTPAQPSTSSAGPSAAQTETATPEPAPTALIRLDVTEQQRGLLLTALAEYQVEQERYARSYPTPSDSGPGPLDMCCPGHLARYEARKREGAMFRESVARIADLSSLVANANASGTPESSESQSSQTAQTSPA